MILFNEKNERLNIGDVKREIKSSLDSEEGLSEKEMATAMDDYYLQALALDSRSYGLVTQEGSMLETVSLRFPSIGGVLGRIRSTICAVLQPNDSLDTIIDVILEAVKNIIPGGIIISFFVKKLAKFILNMGIGSFCRA